MFCLLLESLTSLEHIKYHCTSAHTQRNIDVFGTCPSLFSQCLKHNVSLFLGFHFYRHKMFRMGKDWKVYSFTVRYILASVLLHLASKCRHFRGRHFAFSKVTTYQREKKNTLYNMSPPVMILIQPKASQSVQTFSVPELFLFWLQQILSLSTQRAYILLSLWMQTRLWLPRSDIEKNCAHNLCVVISLHLPPDDFSVMATVLLPSALPCYSTGLLASCRLIALHLQSL